MELARENPRWRGRQQWREGQWCRRTRGGGGLGKRYLVGAQGNGRWRDISPAARGKAAAVAEEGGLGGLGVWGRWWRVDESLMGGWPPANEARRWGVPGWGDIA